MIKILYGYCLAISLTACQDPQQKNVERFKEVNSSLEENAKVLKTYKDVADQIGKETQDQDILKQTETIVSQTGQNIAFLQELKQRLREKDTSGINTGIPAVVLIGKPAAAKIKKAVLEVYQMYSNSLKDPGQQQQLDDLFSSAVFIKDTPDWDKAWFAQIPTVAAITLLSKLQIDHEKAAEFVLQSLYDRIKK